MPTFVPSGSRASASRASESGSMFTPITRAPRPFSIRSTSARWKKLVAAMSVSIGPLGGMSV